MPQDLWGNTRDNRDPPARAKGGGPAHFEGTKLFCLKKSYHIPQVKPTTRTNWPEANHALAKTKLPKGESRQPTHKHKKAKEIECPEMSPRRPNKVPVKVMM